MAGWGFSFLVDPRMYAEFENSARIDLEPGHIYTLHAKRTYGHGYRVFMWIRDEATKQEWGALQRNRFRVFAGSLSQVSQAWTAIQPTPQETHFRVVQEFCKKQAQRSDDGERLYVGCMSKLSQGKEFF